MAAISPENIFNKILNESKTVIVGNEYAIELITISLISRGHTLLEGVPGIAKTTIAKLFANLAGLEYSRVQLMPDLLPADITGSYVYRESTGKYKLQRGPIFSNVVVADEINRATQKTQSAFLEAMEEMAVTIEGETVSIDPPFMVIATQNPLETEGTYELPIAQRDRFQFKLQIALPDRSEEELLVDRFDRRPRLDATKVSQVVSRDEILSAQRTVDEVYIDDKVKNYLLDIVDETHKHPDIEFGASPRAIIAFVNGGKAKAAIDGRNYVIPDDVKSLCKPILTHRMVLSTDAELSGRTVSDVVNDVIENVDPPGSDIDVDLQHEVASPNGRGDQISDGN